MSEAVEGDSGVQHVLLVGGVWGWVSDEEECGGVDKGDEVHSLGLCNSLVAELDAGLCDLVRGARTVTVQCALVRVCSVTVSICVKTQMYALTSLDKHKL